MMTIAERQIKKYEEPAKKIEKILEANLPAVSIAVCPAVMGYDLIAGIQNIYKIDTLVEGVGDIIHDFYNVLRQLVIETHTVTKGYIIFTYKKTPYNLAVMHEDPYKIYTIFKHGVQTAVLVMPGKIIDLITGAETRGTTYRAINKILRKYRSLAILSTYLSLTRQYSIKTAKGVQYAVKQA
jgi:hypothetical protein